MGLTGRCVFGRLERHGDFVLPSGNCGHGGRHGHACGGLEFELDALLEIAAAADGKVDIALLPGVESGCHHRSVQSEGVRLVGNDGFIRRHHLIGRVALGIGPGCLLRLGNVDAPGPPGLLS